MQTPDDNKPGWADREETRQKIRYVLYAICGLLVITELFVTRSIHLTVEKMPAFYAVYGFAALVAVVQLAKALRRLVGRGEDYYQQKDKDDDHAA